MIVRHRVKTTPAQAYVEREGIFLGKDRGNGTLHYWNVEVRSAPGFTPHNRRSYRLILETDEQAAKEALRLFGEELDYLELMV